MSSLPAGQATTGSPSLVRHWPRVTNTLQWATWACAQWTGWSLSPAAAIMGACRTNQPSIPERSKASDASKHTKKCTHNTALNKGLILQKASHAVLSEVFNGVGQKIITSPVFAQNMSKFLPGLQKYFRLADNLPYHYS